MIHYRLKTPRRCLLQDLAHAKNEDEFVTSPVSSFALPAKRQFSRTQTAFGRLQGPISTKKEMPVFKKFQFDDNSNLPKEYI